MSVVLATVVALMTGGCSLLEMPSNSSLEGPAPTVSSLGPAISASSPGTKGAAPELDAEKAERQSADARTASVSIRERVSGTVHATLSGQVLLQAKPLRISEQLSVVVADRTLQLSAIINSRAMYVNASLTPDAPENWVKIPLWRLGGPALLYNVRNADPMSQTRLFLAGQHPHLVGKRTVDGVVTTKYTGYFAPSAALASLPPALRSELAPAISQISGNVHFALWVGPDNYVKKIRETETVSGNRVTLTYTVNWFNHPVHITIPHATAVAGAAAGLVE
jgi:hypothetical protein